MKLDTLPSAPGSLKTAAIVSSVLVLPFMILEVVNRPAFDFPTPLFAFMWLLGLAFVVTLFSVLRGFRLGDRSAPHFVSLLWKTAVLMLVAWVWVSLTIDQMPCFLGVPNCD